MLASDEVMLSGDEPRMSHATLPQLRSYYFWPLMPATTDFTITGQSFGICRYARSPRPLHLLAADSALTHAAHEHARKQCAAHAMPSLMTPILAAEDVSASD